MSSVVWKDSVYVLNHCARSLARTNEDGRHNYGQFSGVDSRGAIAEAWRFPIIDSYRDPDADTNSKENLVTFVFRNRALAFGNSISVIGSFADLITPIPMQRVSDSDYWAVSVTVPKGKVHRYKFLAGKRTVLDSINPQRWVCPDGSEWSRFFTEYCTTPIVLERWEFQLLERLTAHILPFRTAESQRWLSNYYKSLDKESRDHQFPRAFQLEQSVGAANFIDKLLARQEMHRLVDYRICLGICMQLLKLWNFGQDPLKLGIDQYSRLYAAMANGVPGAIDGWDYSRYSNPRFFLQLLRRHTYTGAFSHPKHGGNVGAAGWQFLAQNLKNPVTNTLPKEIASDVGTSYFDWARTLEPPLGRNTEYLG